METPRRPSTAIENHDKLSFRTKLSCSLDSFSATTSRKKNLFVYSKANIEQSPYKESPAFLSLYKGKPQNLPKPVQKLMPTTNNVRVPNSTIQSPVVVVSPKEMPEQVDYLTRSKHDQEFEKMKEKEMTKKYSNVQRNSPYKEKMSSLRKSAIVSTRNLLRNRDIRDYQDRQEFLKEFDTSCNREFNSEKNILSRDVFDRRFNSLRVVVIK